MLLVFRTAFFILMLGLMGCGGRSVPVAAGPDKDDQAAYDRSDYGPEFRLNKPLADQGNADAQNSLGGMFATGRGVRQNDAEAMKWFRLAADQGNPLAQISLGGMFRNARGVPRNDAEAVKWYRLAADQGHANARFNLGEMFRTGQGVPRNDAEAMKWYRLAADQGNALARFNLGEMYRTGQGVPQNDAEAMKWFRLAANQGHAGAQAIQERGRIALEEARLREEKERPAKEAALRAAAKEATLRVALRAAADAYGACVRGNVDRFAVASDEPAETIARASMALCRSQLSEARDRSCDLRRCSYGEDFERLMMNGVMGWVLVARARHSQPAPPPLPRTLRPDMQI